MSEPSDNGRTCGDGMENASTAAALPLAENSTKPAQQLAAAAIELPKPMPASAPVLAAAPRPTSNNLSTKIPGEHLIYRAHDQPNRSLPAVIPRGKIFNLIPRLVASSSSKSSPSSSAAAAAGVQALNRKPKFVPFEPYKAAITPLVAPIAHRRHKIPAPPAPNRNNLDLNTLVQHISCTTTAATACSAAASQPTTASELATQRDHYERQLAELRKERDSYAAQLKSQVQVNAELKHLLVAAVGEDLQTRVNVLTEDKLHLARALLSTAENLSSHTEQIEYLASQSEVWRSKFLASSLMVEELARWKASLHAKNRSLADATRQLLHTVATVRDMSAEAFANLRFVAQRPRATAEAGRMPSCNVLDLTAECLNITQQLVLHSEAGGVPAPVDLGGLDATTGAEKLALLALSTPDDGQLLRQTDAAFRAVVEQAFPVNGKATPSQPTEVAEGPQ